MPLILFPVFASSLSVAQSTWLPEGDYRLYLNPSSFSSWHNPHLKGVKMTQQSANNDSIHYSNYTQFNWFRSEDTNPPYNWEYYLEDQLTPFGYMTLDIANDRVLLFRDSLWLMNHPVANTTWIARTNYQGQHKVEITTASSYVWSAPFQDSVLELSIKTFNAQNQRVASLLLDGATLYYGQNHGLLGFDPVLTGTPSKQEPINWMHYSTAIPYGEFIESPMDVFGYENGMEIHTVRVETGYWVWDSTLRIRHILDVQLNGNILRTIDSVYEQSFRVFLDSNSDYIKSVPTYGKFLDTTFTDLSDYSLFGTAFIQTALDPMNSATNRVCTSQEARFDVDEKIIFAGPYGADPDDTTPPFSYVASQIDEAELHYAYFRDAGGPYEHYITIAGSDEEFVVYYKTSDTVKGVPLDRDVVSSFRKPNLSELNLYPNPAENTVHMDLNEHATWRITLISIDGKTIVALPFEGNSYELDLSAVKPGVYLVRAQSGTAVITERLVIQR